jgi:hypothetical protein
MKTIFITAFQSYVSKNILNTDVLKVILSDNNIRVVIFVHPAKEHFFKNIYTSPNIFIESLNVNKIVNTFPHRFFDRVSKFMIDSNYLKYKRVEKLNNNKDFVGYVKYFFESVVVKVFKNSKIFLYIFRYVYITFGNRNLLEKYFKKYNPDLIFSTDIFDVADTVLLQESKSRNITSIGMVRSWDNCYSKGALKVIPESTIVNNEIIKEEAVSIHLIPEDIIFVGGMPQFDSFIKDKRETRENFCNDIDIDIQNKKLILFAPAGKRLSDTDWQICQILSNAIEDSSIKYPVHILVRNHPNHPAELSKFEDLNNFTIETPGHVLSNENRKETEVTKEGTAHLADSLYNSDLVIWVATTLGIDSLVFDKPQIAINFDGYKNKDYWNSVKRYHDEDHMKKMLELGGVSVVNNSDELIEAVNKYLDNPSFNTENREKTRKQQLYKVDGKSGERIGNFILSKLK